MSEASRSTVPACVTPLADAIRRIGLSISLTIIGAGRVGKTLARCMHRQKVAIIADVVTRSAQSADAAVQFIGGGNALCDIAELGSADIFMLAVPDDQIESCCVQLVKSGRLQPHNVVFHCSGALPCSILNAARTAGAAVASIHPIRSFADPAMVADHFINTYCGVEGDDAALAILSPLLTKIGAVLVPIAGNSKTLYHAAAVFASNYIVSVMSVAQQALVAAGIDDADALAILLPLTRESIENVARLGPAAALTGPIARGDTEVVARQQAAIMNWDRDYGVLYQHLVLATQRLAASRNANLAATIAANDSDLNDIKR